MKKISESEFRRLHWKSRALDRVCRILWPDGPGEQDIGETVWQIKEAIGTYRPGPNAAATIPTEEK